MSEKKTNPGLSEEELFEEAPTTSTSGSQFNWRRFGTKRKPSPGKNEETLPIQSAEKPEKLTRTEGRSSSTEDVRVENPPADQPLVSDYETSLIFVTWAKKMGLLRKILSNTLPKEEYETKLIGNYDIAIKIFNPAAYRTVTEALKRRQIRYYKNQFLQDQDKLFKVILRGFEYTTDIKIICSALRNLGHKVIRICTVLLRQGEPLPFFVIKLETRDNNSQIFNIKRLANVDVSFESPYEKQWFYFYAKCHRCQEFGHLQKHCSQLRCTLCYEDHDTVDCPTNMKSLHMKCFNCGRAHSPTYECSLVREVEENQEKEERDQVTPPIPSFSAYPPMLTTATTSSQPSISQEREPSPTMPKRTYAQVAGIPLKNPPKSKSTHRYHSYHYPSKAPL